VKPYILAVDTTHEFGSLALARGEELIEELPLHSPAGFSQVLYGHLAALLGNHGLQVGDVDRFAAASGPGSFTGVRVGLACVKGLAEALNKPAVAVSNLQALATFGAAPLRAVVLDARRGEIYGAVYDDAARLVSAEVVAKFPEWLACLPAGLPSEVEFISQESVVLPPMLAGTRFESARVITAPHSLAAAIARLAFTAAPSDPAALDANYVRRSDAELFWKE
jgi:tRNA threonylcarbamoyladenosine biosynthesis protein TsaB